MLTLPQALVVWLATFAICAGVTHAQPVDCNEEPAACAALDGMEEQ